MKKLLLIAASIVIALFVALVAWASLFFDANQLRPRLETALGGASGRKVTLGKIHLALWSGRVAVDDVAIGDDPNFGTDPFVTADTVGVGIELLPLITSRDLRVESFRLDGARVRLIRNASGSWNFSSLGGANSSRSRSSSAGSAGAVAGAIVRRIAVTNGQLQVLSGPGRGKQRVYDHVNAEVRDLSMTSRFPFELTARTPGGGSLDIKGDAGPIDADDAAATPIDAKVALKRLDIAATGFLDPASGLSGLVDFSGQLRSDGRTMAMNGTLHATRARLVAGGSAARVPVDVDYDSGYATKSQRGVLKRGEVRVGRAVASLTGAYTLAGETPAVEMKLAGHGMPITDLEAALPAIGVTLPSGASMKRGRVDSDLTIAGPADRLVISGPVTLSDAVMSGFDLGGKLQAIAALAGVRSSGETAIETLGCRLRIAPQGIQIDDLRLVAPAIGTMTGSGTIDASGTLAFAMLAKPASTRGPADTLTRVASLGQPANGIPFRIQGTTKNPVFTPDVDRAAVNVLKSDETRRKAADLLGGLFGRKKK